MPSRGRSVNAGVRGRLLVLPSEGSAGVLGCPSTPSGVIVGWQGTAGVEGQSAEAKVPAGSMSPGRAEREAGVRDTRARGMDDDRQPRVGSWRTWVPRVKPGAPRRERSRSPAPSDTAPHPAETSLWERFMSRENLAEALRRVGQNAGAAGPDGMGTKELRPWLKDHWLEVRSRLDAGTYRPQPVGRVTIPKPSGGRRMLGVPAAVDRLICQAIAQVLTPIFDPHFHRHSFGYRPGRSAHQAVERARPLRLRCRGVVRRLWFGLVLRSSSARRPDGQGRETGA
jgi:hypothetical protein